MRRRPNNPALAMVRCLLAGAAAALSSRGGGIAAARSFVSSSGARRGGGRGGAAASSVAFHASFARPATTASPPRRTLASSPRARFETPASQILSAAAASSTVEDESASSSAGGGPVPVTLLAGFLGTGKTTALKNLLENRSGVRVGVVVNDVASVNIDAKLISDPGRDSPSDSSSSLPEGEEAVMTDFGGTVELQNGCACCSLQDELLVSVENLMKGRELDAVVVELSGVADPVAVKNNWAQAKLAGHPATLLADVDRVVTVVDACTFGTDWMTWNTAGDRQEWSSEVLDDCSASRQVPELLAEQVEAADLLLINKIDLAGSEQVEVASSLAKSLNEKAELYEVEFGRVAPEEILGPKVVVAPPPSEPVEEEASSGHSHDHDHDDAHSHSHSHDHDVSAACSDPDCSDPSHSHSHDHDPSCSDPDCTDASHSHSHDHKSTSTANLGIVNFVYKSDRPFDAVRLLTVLNSWPVPIKDELDLGEIKRAQEEGYDLDEDGTTQKSPFVGVLRSKGFCWMGPTRWTGPAEDTWRHDTAMYWSHAGKHFGITTAGRWWGTIGKDKMKDYFSDNVKEYDRIMKEDWATEEWGDRRQEIVFIGTNLDEEEITKTLDGCLCTDEEMTEYRRNVKNTIVARASAV